MCAIRRPTLGNIGLPKMTFKITEVHLTLFDRLLPFCNFYGYPFYPVFRNGRVALRSFRSFFDNECSRALYMRATGCRPG